MTENFSLKAYSQLKLPLQSHKIGCMHKTPFCKYAEFCDKIIGVIHNSLQLHYSTSEFPLILHYAFFMHYSQDYCQNNPGALKIIIFIAKHGYSIGVIIIKPTVV